MTFETIYLILFIIMGVGVFPIAFPTSSVIFALAGLVMLGIGAASIYPSIIVMTERVNKACLVKQNNVGEI